MNRPLISIVIPVYNEEAVIADCLSSVCSQTLSRKEYEVILVNNASKDKTEQIARSFGVKIINEPKKGYVYALRAGCEAAQGYIIAITDADTIVLNDWAEKIGDAYEKDPDIVAVGGGTILSPGFFSAKLIQSGLNAVGQMFHYLPGYNSSVRQDIYKKSGGFREDINFNTDTEFCQRLKRYGKTIFLTDNPVINSSRHYRGINGLIYCIKGLTNSMLLLFFGKTIFFHFKDIRE